MTQPLQVLGNNIFQFADVYTPAECLQFIQRAESIGFDAASVQLANSQQLVTQIRNNDRVTLHDQEVADGMWNRISAFLPMLDSCHPVGVDGRIRFYRYLPGQRFKRHKDGSATDDAGHVSKLSYLIYLNDEFEGGETTFYEFRNVNGGQEQVELAVKPVTVSAILFCHECWHAGMPVITGRKYVLRSDVFYSSPG